MLARLVTSEFFGKFFKQTGVASWADLKTFQLSPRCLMLAGLLKIAFAMEMSSIYMV